MRSRYSPGSGPTRGSPAAARRSPRSRRMTLSKRQTISGAAVGVKARRGSIDGERRKPRDRSAGDVEVVRVELEADAPVANGLGGCECRARTGKWVEKYTVAERKNCPHELAQEGLRLETWVRSDSTLVRARRCRRNHVVEGLDVREPPEATRLPATKAILNASFDRLPEEEPRFPRGTRHDTHLWEIVVSVLRAIPAAHRHHEADNLTSSLKSCPHDGTGDEVRDERVGSDDNVRARNENWKNGLCPGLEESLKLDEVFRGQRSESRKGRTLVPIERWRDAPHASATDAELLLLLWAVLHEPIGGICDDRVDAIRRLPVQPCETVSEEETAVAVLERWGYRFRSRLPRPTRTLFIEPPLV